MLKTMDDAEDSMSPPEKSFRNKFQFYTGVETPGQAMAVHKKVGSGGRKKNKLN